MRIISLALGIAGLMACESNVLDEKPCDRYADYICTCHQDDPDFDCDEFIILAEANPSPAVSDQCALDLGNLKDQDEAEGFVCAA